jgi:hypothetical protein
VIFSYSNVYFNKKMHFKRRVENALSLGLGGKKKKVSLDSLKRFRYNLELIFEFHKKRKKVHSKLWPKKKKKKPNLTHFLIMLNWLLSKSLDESICML